MTDDDINHILGEHTHPTKTSSIVWMLLACVIVLSGIVVGLGVHLHDRQNQTDAHNTLNAEQVMTLRTFLCVVLDEFPPSPQVEAAKAYPFPVSATRHVPLCNS